MVEGGDWEQEDTSSTYDCVGLASNSEAKSHDQDTEALLNTLDIPRNLPSIIDIKRALPQHAFVSDASTSMYYFVKDIVQVVVTFCVAEFIWSYQLLPTWALITMLPVFWLLQGTFFTAFFSIGHDCGHSSFSRYDWLNDIVGNIAHTFIFMPYYPWKLSHRNHHKNTGNMDKDEAFYPIRKKDEVHTTMIPGFGLGLAWYNYLVVGYGSRPVNHYNPSLPMFRGHFVKCILSIIIIFAWIVVLAQYAMSAGFLKLFVHYLVPVLICGSYMVIITFLHHSEDGIPWYTNSLWNNVRGQLSSVDRHYGWCHDILHNITTHQIHHLFTKVPHYHLEEATIVFRQKFPQLVHVRGERILPTFWRMFLKFANQRIVANSTKLFLYK